MTTKVDVVTCDPALANLKVSDDVLDTFNHHVVSQLGWGDGLFATSATSHCWTKTLSLANTSKMLLGTVDLLVAHNMTVPAR
jgi:hypothetical protein